MPSAKVPAVFRRSGSVATLIAGITTIELVSGGPTISFGSGTPEGVVTAPIGSSFHRDDLANAVLYVKMSGSGNTGWGAVVSPSGGATDIDTSAFALVGSFGARSVFNTKVETLTPTSGSTVSTTGLVQAGSRLLGISAVHVLAVTGPTSLQYGDGTDADRFGTGIGVGLGLGVTMADATADPSGWSASTQDVTVTAVGGDFTGGTIRVQALYLTTEK